MCVGKEAMDWWSILFKIVSGRTCARSGLSANMREHARVMAGSSLSGLDCGLDVGSSSLGAHSLASRLARLAFYSSSLVRNFF